MKRSDWVGAIVVIAMMLFAAYLCYLAAGMGPR